MCSELHYDYVRLAWDAGFNFTETETKSNFSFNHLALVDIDRVSKERDIAAVVKHLPTVLSFKLDDGLEKILEPTFIKVFRLSQLSIQYLQFCKKYLDGTVVILKKDVFQANQENKKLSLYLEDLKAENDKLREKNSDLKETFSVFQQTASFKCSECSKTFLSEEYLELHFKRRHNSNSQIQKESEKLQLEIKELKQRLNNTEKYIQYEKLIEKEKNESKELPNNDIVIKKGKGEGDADADVLEEKFMDLRKHIVSELKSLKDEKFYGKLFDDLIEKIDKTKKSFVEKGCGDFQCHVVDNGTQTECNEVPTPLPRKIDSQVIEKKVEDCLLNLESRVNAICDKIDNQEEKVLKFQNSETEKEKLTQSAHNIERVDFSEKQNFINEQRKEALIIDDNNENISDHDTSPEPDHVENTNIKNYYVKVLPKTLISKDKYKKNNESIENYENSTIINDKTTTQSKNPFEESESTYNKSRALIKYANMSKSNINQILNLSTTSESSETDNSSEDEIVKNVNKKEMEYNIKLSTTKSHDDTAPATKTKTKKEQKSYKLKSKVVKENKKKVPENKYFESNKSDLSSNSHEVVSKGKFNKEQNKLYKIRKRDIQELIDLKLKSLGVSPHWKSLPEKSYKQANSNLEQQALLFKKNLPNYLKKHEEILKIISRKINNSKIEDSIHNPSTSFDSKHIKIKPQKLEKMKSIHENPSTPSKSALKNKPQDNQGKKKVFFNLSSSGSSSSLLSSILDDNDKILKFSKEENKENLKVASIMDDDLS